MAGADKLNLIQSSENTGYRSVRPTLGAKDLRTEKNDPEVPSAVSEARTNRRMMWEQGALACGNLLPIASTRFRVAGGAFGNCAAGSNWVRPRPSLAYLTPLEFITRWKENSGRAKCHDSTGRVQLLEGPVQS